MLISHRVIRVTRGPGYCVVTVAVAVNSVVNEFRLLMDPIIGEPDRVWYWLPGPSTLFVYDEEG